MNFANGSYIGYSQNASRVGIFDECSKMTLPNPARINKPVNCDCATLVGAAIYLKVNGTWQEQNKDYLSENHINHLIPGQ